MSTTKNLESIPLVACHGCGYEIPCQIDAVCPECSSMWDADASSRDELRQHIHSTFGTVIRANMVWWLIVLVIYALGAFMASEGSWESLVAAFFGIGFGVVASLGLGIGICKLGPPHEFRLRAHLWTQQLWWLHTPWLLIGPLTAVGVIIALAFRWTDPMTGGVVVWIYILLALFAWAILSFVAIVIWLDQYTTTRKQLGLIETGPVVGLHTLYAFMIWIGSGIVGFFGGILGAFFMGFVVGEPTWDF
ncbi:MAG: hypothetical protein RLN78_04490 [Phycisphaerales bacterium]